MPYCSEHAVNLPFFDCLYKCHHLVKDNNSFFMLLPYFLTVNSPLSPSITPSLFHSQLKTYLFHKSFPP